ncbi:hypothetical protein BU15DRAFT_61619 [Melanogaster broomeanus]|nr:hypothetical protein BU15DRAFT_61619 [Melanogaster broomeanus]
MSILNASSTNDRNTRIHQELLDSGLYLGDRAILQHVEWKPNGRRESLFIKESPSSPSDDQKPSSDDSVADLATLSTVVRINDNGFWLTSDAGWRAPTDITPHLRDAKASCIGVSPLTGVFRDDFFLSVENAHLLQQQIATPNAGEHLGFACKGEGQFAELKFRHMLFERMSEKPDSQTLHATVDLATWPVHSDGAQEELDEMKNNYRAIPLAAYDIQDHLIPPSSYRQKLQGAIVEIDFDLSHSAFRNKDTYTTDIRTIRVLKPPPYVTPAPKRSLPTTLPSRNTK